MKSLVKYADTRREKSAANNFRRKRFLHFEKIIGGIPSPVKILDVGGTYGFWKVLGADSGRYSITVLNRYPEPENKTSDIAYVQGDAADLKILNDKKFDVIFSNSVIEHIGSEEKLGMMADKIRKSGSAYYIQTPNYYFPMEPHFLFPFFQFFPESIRVFLVRNFSLGWYSRCNTREEAVNLVRSVRLLGLRKLKRLFPDSAIYRERFYGITKSITVYRV